MNLYSREGYVSYASSTIAAWLSGCLPVLLLGASALLGAASVLWTIAFYALAIAWTSCYVVPLLFLSSRALLPSVMAILGSSSIAIFCGHVILVRGRMESDPLVSGPGGPPAWLVLSIPLLFNALQASLSIFRSTQIRTAR